MSSQSVRMEEQMLEHLASAVMHLQKAKCYANTELRPKLHQVVQAINGLFEEHINL